MARRNAMDMSSFIPTDPSLSWLDLMELHKQSGAGLNKGQHWNDELLALRAGVISRTLRLRRAGKSVAGEADFDQLMRAFKLLNELGEPDNRDDFSKQCESVFRKAWRRAKFGGQPIGGDGDAAFPFPLPAALVERRAAIRAEIAKLLSLSASDKRHPLASLTAAWRSRTLPDPVIGDADVEEPRRLFQEFKSAVRQCNGAQPPWGDAVDVRTVDRRNRRVDDCTQIARLLFALAWTPQAWLDLPGARDKVQVHQVSDATLLHAGIAAASGRMFDLPVDPNVVSNGPALDIRRHVRLHDAVKAGIGMDERIRLIDEVAVAAGYSTFLRPKRNDAVVGPIFDAHCERLASWILEVFEDENGPALLVSRQPLPGKEDDKEEDVAPLLDFVKSMRCDPSQPSIIGLACSGLSGTGIRGPEIGLLQKVHLCRETIASIP